MIDPGTLPASAINEVVYRVISTRYPQINLFERVANADQWDILYQVESLTNPRLRQEAGDISLVPPEDRVYGDGSSWIMAAFTHPPTDGRGCRFNRDFGVYYCSVTESVSIAESSYHRARFLRESRIESTTVEVRVIRAQLNSESIHDLCHLAGTPIYDPEIYNESQALGLALKNLNSFGLNYTSVRSEGECIGVFRPLVLADANHLRYLRYHFHDGEIVEVEKLDGN